MSPRKKSKYSIVSLIAEPRHQLNYLVYRYPLGRAAWSAWTWNRELFLRHLCDAEVAIPSMTKKEYCWATWLRKKAFFNCQCLSVKHSIIGLICVGRMSLRRQGVKPGQSVTGDPHFSNPLKITPALNLNDRTSNFHLSAWVRSEFKIKMLYTRTSVLL